MNNVHKMKKSQLRYVIKRICEHAINKNIDNYYTCNVFTSRKKMWNKIKLVDPLFLHGIISSVLK
jgi:hypothetical protein